LQIKNDNGSLKNIEIYNVLGAKIFDGMLKQVQHDCQINLSSQPNGVYLYRIINQSGKPAGNGKFVIER
jgi:hypothetical protein